MQLLALTRFNSSGESKNKTCWGGLTSIKKIIEPVIRQQPEKNTLNFSNFKKSTFFASIKKKIEPVIQQKLEKNTLNFSDFKKSTVSELR